MGAWGLSLGRWMGVDVRVHAIVFLLLALLAGGTTAAGTGPGRGLALWCIIVTAVALREVARLLATLALGLQLRKLVITPLCALPTFARGEVPSTAQELALAGAALVANLGFGLAVLGLSLSFSPTADLLHHPWITPAWLLRSLIWTNLLLAALHLLPAVPLDAGRLARTEIASHRDTDTGSRATSGLSRLVAFLLVFGGMAFGSTWLGCAGLLLLLVGTLDRHTALSGAGLGSVRMRDVMLEDFQTLSSADTLEEALHRALHAAQDVFPVVRSGSLVGAVSRRGILEALDLSGNGYVQGVMTRELVTAAPDDRLLGALERMTGRSGAQLLPIVDGDRVVGIITPQNLSLSSRLLARKARLRRASGRGA